MRTDRLMTNIQLGVFLHMNVYIMWFIVVKYGMRTRCLMVSIYA